MLLAGDDLEMSQAVLFMGRKIFYHEGLLIHHQIPSARTEWNYIKKIYAGYGASTISLDLYDWFYKDKYLNASFQMIWFRHLLTFVKPSLRYNILLLGFYRLLPKGSVLTTRVVFAIGRWKGFVGQGFAEYRNNLEIVRRFCKNANGLSKNNVN